MPMAKTQVWTCITCRTEVHTAYCPGCGEEPVRAHDLNFRQLIVEFFHSATDLDSRFVRSFRRLLFSPGMLTNAYVRGPRKPYISPFQLFLMVNVLFFAVQALSTEKVFSNRLESHLHGQDWSPLAQRLVAERLNHRHVT